MNNDVGEAGTTRVLYVYIPSQLCSALLSQSSSLRLPTESTDESHSNPLRVILAMHGYGGRALQEIKKWHDSAVSLNSIILAPQGTLTPSTNKLGWNAIHCCGDPVLNEIDDMGFIMNGVVEVFLNTLRRRGDENYDVWKINVIATGFSNGGFVSSLLGLLSVANRPSWLVGIVPMGGYQYDVELYDGSSKPHPLPMMSHHGGRDSVVYPNGCCASTNNSESNCYFDIGIKQRTCTSVQSAFEMWSHINGCSSTVLDEHIVNDRRVEKVGKDQEPIVTCWKGIDCIDPTNFCLWNNEGHAWGFQFPGIGMAQTWMEAVFHSAETRSSNLIEEHTIITEHGDESNISYASAISNNQHSKKGKLIFSATVALLGVFIVVFYTRKKVRCFSGLGRKRKTSDENLTCGNDEDRIAREKLVVSDAH